MPRRRLAWIDRWGTRAQIGGYWIAAQQLVDPHRECPAGPTHLAIGIVGTTYRGKYRPAHPFSVFYGKFTRGA